MRKFDYSLLKTMQISGALVKKISAVSRMEARAELLLPAMPNPQRLGGYAARFDETADAKGYADALALVRKNSPPSGDDLREMHRALMSRAGDPGAGSYTSSDGLIVEYDGAGNRKVRFRPVRAADVPAAVDMIFGAAGKALDDGAEPLLLVPCVFLDLANAAPFEKGGAAVSLLACRSLMGAAGYPAVSRVPLEKYALEGSGRLAEALRRSSAGWNTGSCDPMPVIRVLLDVIYRAYSEKDAAFPSGTLSGGRKEKKYERIESALASAGGPLSKADLCALLPDVSVSTVEAVLGRLLREGRIRMRGAGKSARYETA